METVTKVEKERGIFQQMAPWGHEELAFWYDKATGLKAVVAIHDTTLGPALGGTRMRPYATVEEAIWDVVRLSRAMTYKNAAAGLNFGGGKAVIIGDPARDKSEGLFRAFARFVHSLGGRYITTTDVGISPDDLVHIRHETLFVTGLPEAFGGGGDTSVTTALGIWEGMKICIKEALGTTSLAGVRVAVQGVGKVGYKLVGHLVKDGARVTVTDVDDGHLRKTSVDFPVKVVSPEEIYDVECEIFSPNALGAVLNDDTIPRLRCAVVAGGANNQLAEENHAIMLLRRGILYAPDFVINAGGVINCAEELEPGGYRLERALERTRGIARTLERVFTMAKELNITPAQAADRLVEARIGMVGQIHRTFVPGNNFHTL